MYAALWILFGAFVIDIIVRLHYLIISLNELNENVKIQNKILDKMDVLNGNIEEDDEEDDEEEYVDENDPEEIRLREMLKNGYAPKGRAPPLEAYNGNIEGDDEEDDEEEHVDENDLDTKWNSHLDEIWNNENDPGEVSLRESLENVYNSY
jgi:hypothetical protein